MSDAKDKCLNCAAELPALICPECRRFVDAWSKWIIASENAKALGRDLAAKDAEIEKLKASAGDLGVFLADHERVCADLAAAREAVKDCHEVIGDLRTEIERLKADNLAAFKRGVNLRKQSHDLLVAQLDDARKDRIFVPARIRELVANQRTKEDDTNAALAAECANAGHEWFRRQFAAQEAEIERLKGVSADQLNALRQFMSAYAKLKVDTRDARRVMRAGRVVHDHGWLQYDHTAECWFVTDQSLPWTIDGGIPLDEWERCTGQPDIDAEETP